MSHLWITWGKRVSGGAIAISLAGLLLTPSCQRDEYFKDLGEKVSNPSAVAASADGAHFYVLNADFERLYNVGSILTLDPNGRKESAVQTPRLGRDLAVAGTDMIALMDSSEDSSKAHVQLYDLSAPAKPSLTKEWRVPCSPLHTVMRSGYKYFFVACLGGDLYAGELKTPRANSTLRRIRHWGNGITRRAMYLDPTREVLIAFPAVVSEQVTGDFVSTDSYTYNDDSGVKTAASNETPDAWERTARLRAYRGGWNTFRMTVLDIASEAERGFPFRTQSQAESRGEYRWVYFALKQADGTDDSTLKTGQKYFRTNFWDVQPDPDDSDVFYLSHRGKKSLSPHANNVLKVTLTDSTTSILPVDGVSPKTSDIMTFERVYGFTDEVRDNHYPGDIDVVTVSSQKLLVINHFRDLLWRKRADVEFGVAVKILGNNTWVEDVHTDDPHKSYYRLAFNGDGQGFSLSVYGSTVIPLDIAPSAAIRVGKSID